MTPRVAVRRAIGRRGTIALALLLVVAGLPPATARSSPDPPPEPLVEEIAAIVVAEVPAPPLFVGLAHLIVPPGAGTDTVLTAGPRLLIVESGGLVVATAGPATAFRAARPGGGTPSGPEPVAAGADVTLAPGDRLALGSGAVREVRNGGTRPTVYLDVALFPPGPAPVDVAFTTEDGISFQLLAGAVVDSIPPVPLEFALRRLHVVNGGSLPGRPRPGPALAYVESGSLGLVPTAGDVRLGRTSAAIPFSMADPMKPVALGAKASLTAGASAILAMESAVDAGNQRDAPVSILLVELLPASSAAGTPASLPSSAAPTMTALAATPPSN